MSFKTNFLCLVVLLLAGCTSIPNGISPVSDFDVNRYLGTWYEIARFDHSFERGLERVTADYSVREDGGIAVVNRGFNPETNEWEEALGKAYFVSNEQVGHLKVSFFGPFYASYVVFQLDKNKYSYSLVTGPNRDYLWILARTPIIDESIYTELIIAAKNQGFDTSKLIKVNQNPI